MSKTGAVAADTSVRVCGGEYMRKDGRQKESACWKAGADYCDVGFDDRPERGQDIIYEELMIRIKFLLHCGIR